MGYSSQLRTATMNQAISVGGAFLGFKMTSTEVAIPKDTIHIFGDRNNVATYFTKISYDSGLFVITDFLRKTVRVLRTIESELEFRTNPPRQNTDISSLIERAAWLQAPITFLKHNSATGQVVSILESASGSSIRNAPSQSFTWIEPNQEMSFELQSGEIVRLRIP